MKSFRLKPVETKEFLNFLEEDLENIRRVIKALEDRDVEFEVHSKSETIEESVESSPLDEERIIKTLIFKNESGDLLAVLCPGDKRVDESKLEEELCESIDMAERSEIKEKTGYIVGGVSPFDLDIPVFASDEIPEGELRPSAGSRVVGVKIERNVIYEVLNPEVLDLT